MRWILLLCLSLSLPALADLDYALKPRLIAEDTWLLADSSKYGRAGFVSVLPLSGLAGIITDSGLAPEAAEQLTVTVPDLRIV